MRGPRERDRREKRVLTKRKERESVYFVNSEIERETEKRATHGAGRRSKRRDSLPSRSLHSLSQSQMLLRTGTDSPVKVCALDQPMKRIQLGLTEISVSVSVSQ